MQSNTSVEKTIDEDEIAKFSTLAEEWWNPSGSFKPLHKFSPVRLAYIKEKICEIFNLDNSANNAFQGLKILDVGCGGGLLAEPMARLSADVTGIDPSQTNIEVAKLHAKKIGLSIDYRNTTAEDLMQTGELFDVVLNMEVVEHVPNVSLFISQCASLIKPGGLMFVATINRTIKAYLLAIVGAEKILRWLPQGTHNYDMLVKPAELESEFANCNLTLEDRCGVVYNPFQDCWKRSADMDVNYMLLASKPANSSN